MSNKWEKLTSQIPVEIPYVQERLQQIPLLAEKCFPDQTAKESLQECIEKLHTETLLLENFAKLLFLLEKGIGNSFKGEINDSLLDEPIPESFYTPLPQQQFLLLLAVSCIPAGEKAFIRQGLPLEKLYEALDEYSSWSRNCRRNFGITGLSYTSGFAWLVFRILPGIVLRFGRLEYNKCLFFPEFLVFRHKKTGGLTTLINGKYEVNNEGKIAQKEEEISFQTSSPFGIFGSYTGNPVSPDGRIISETITIDPDEYELLLRPGDEVLYMHIPELGSLTPEKAEDSFRKVKAFYEEKDRGFHPKGIVCGSWLFDPVLQELLPEEANLPRFQKTGFLLPPKVPYCDVIFRVFGQQAVEKGISQVQWQSSLQKLLGEYLHKGGRFRGGRYFRLF